MSEPKTPKPKPPKSRSKDIAILSGHARIDLAKLDEAESMISVALTVARSVGDPHRVASEQVARQRIFVGRRSGAVQQLPERHVAVGLHERS